MFIAPIVVPGASLYLALDVERVAFLAVLRYDLSRLTPNYQPVPFGFLLTVIALAPGF